MKRRKGRRHCMRETIILHGGGFHRRRMLRSWKGVHRQLQISSTTIASNNNNNNSMARGMSGIYHPNPALSSDTTCSRAMHACMVGGLVVSSHNDSLGLSLTIRQPGGDPQEERQQACSKRDWDGRALMGTISLNPKSVAWPFLA